VHFRTCSKIVLIEISETTVEVLPRLFKIKYDSGTLQELLFVDMPREYENTSGQIVLDYAKAIHESVFEQLRVVRDGQLRLIFSPDLKVVSYYMASCFKNLYFWINYGFAYVHFY
jgi:hypothetical protein